MMKHIKPFLFINTTITIIILIEKLIFNLNLMDYLTMNVILGVAVGSAAIRLFPVK